MVRSRQPDIAPISGPHVVKGSALLDTSAVLPSSTCTVRYTIKDCWSPPLPCPTHLASGVTSVSLAPAICRPLFATLVLLRVLWPSTFSRAFFSVPSASPSTRLPADDGLRSTEQQRAALYKSPTPYRTPQEVLPPPSQQNAAPPPVADPDTVTHLLSLITLQRRWSWGLDRTSSRAVLPSSRSCVTYIRTYVYIQTDSMKHMSGVVGVWVGCGWGVRYRSGVGGV